MLPLVRGHNRSSVGFASAELGTFTGPWEGASHRERLWDVYNPVLTRGLHGRAAKVYMDPPQDELNDSGEVLVSLCITHETLL